MASKVAVAAVLLLAVLLRAQEIPPGTALPVSLNSALDARKAKPEQEISASLAQDVPLPAGAKMRRGSRVSGRVLRAGVNSDGTSYIRLKFDRIREKNREASVTTSLRALASWWEVKNALLPTRTPVRGESAANWITVQVGDDVVYRGGGHVMHGEVVVGDPVYDGVLAELVAVPESGCTSGSERRRLALWVFSSSACGAYGFDDLEIENHRETGSLGEIVLRSKTAVHLDSGSGMLLVTEGPEPHP